MGTVPVGSSQTLLHNSSSVTSQPSTRILNSWKEIASYLGRGVRTIQRYEAQLGLPIHRPAAKERSAVVAFADELEQWLRSTPGRNGNATHSNSTNGKSSAGPEITEIHLKPDLESELKRAKEDMERAHAEYRSKRELYNALKCQIEAAKAIQEK